MIISSIMIILYQTQETDIAITLQILLGFHLFSMLSFVCSCVCVYSSMKVHDTPSCNHHPGQDAELIRFHSGCPGAVTPSPRPSPGNQASVLHRSWRTSYKGRSYLLRWVFFTQHNDLEGHPGCS